MPQMHFGLQGTRRAGRRLAGALAALLFGAAGLGITVGVASPAGAADMVPVTGVVTSAVDGLPIGGARVCVSGDPWTGAMPICETADAAGAYSVSVPASSLWNRVYASKDGYLTSVPVAAYPVTLPGPVVDIVLSPVPPIQGTVLFSDGTIASDARVCAIPIGLVGEICVAVDPATGSYSLNVFENSVFYLRFESPSGAFLTEFNDDVDAWRSMGLPVPSAASSLRPDLTAPLIVDATVDAGSTISGTLIDDVDLTLVRPVQVCAFVDGIQFKCVESTGSYTLTGVPTGTVTLEFGEPDGVYGLTPWADSPGAPVATPIVISTGGQSLAAYDASLTAQYLLEPYVRDTLGGPLIEGISICVIFISGDEQCMVTGVDMPYMFIPGGPFTVRYSDPLGRYATTYWGDSADLADATWINPHDVSEPTLMFDAVVPVGAILQRVSAATTTTSSTTSVPTTTAAPTTTTGGSVAPTTAATGLTTTTGVATTRVTATTSTTTTTSMTTATTTTAAVATTTAAAPATTAAAQVLGATQTAATPASRTGGNGFVLLAGVGAALSAAGLVTLAVRRRR